MKMWIKILYFFVMLSYVCSIPVISADALTDVTYLGKQDSLKILAIGNSFSEDATEYIPMIAKDMGIKNIVVGNMHISGCTIATHASNAKNNKADYKYYKNTTYGLMSAGPSIKNVSLETALKDEEWDVITLQQSSLQSGLESTYNSDLEYMVDYVKSLCPNAKIGWHMTWSYQNNHTSSAFKAYYQQDQIKMYGMIADCVQKHVVANEKIDFVIPAGTAVQNARTSWLGDSLTRDGLHMTLDYGRYIVAATWFEAMGFDLDNLKTMPKGVSDTVLPFIKDTVHDAVVEMFTVTQSDYSYEPGTTPPTPHDPEGEMAGKTNVALGKTYVGAATSPIGSYSANLTDGIASEQQEYDSSWFGFYYNKDAPAQNINAPDGVGQIIIDLEDLIKRIFYVRVHVWNNNNKSGVESARSITLYVSEDGDDFSQVGSLFILSVNEPDWAYILLDDISARYVMLEVETKGAWTFLNEIEVYADLDYVPEEDTSDKSSDESSEVSSETLSEASSEIFSETSSEASSEVFSETSSKTSSEFESSDASFDPVEDGGLGAWICVIIGISVVALGAVTAIVLKKKK